MKRIPLITVFSVVAVMVLAAAHHARGDLMISFSEDGSFAEYTVNPGEQIDIPVYLRQSGDQSELGNHLTQFGVKTFGVKVMPENMTSGHITGGTLADEWKDGILSKVQLDAAVGSVALFGSRPLGVNDPLFPPTSSNAMLLGYLVYEASVPGVNILTAVDPDGKKQIVLGNNVSYDADVFFQTPSLTINTVPEPGTLVLVLISVVSVGTVRFLRRRGKP